MYARTRHAAESSAIGAPMLPAATASVAAYCGECGEPLAALEGYCPICGAPVEPAAGWGAGAHDATVAFGIGVSGATGQLAVGERQIDSRRAARARRRARITAPRLGVVLTGAVAAALLALATVTALGADEHTPPDDTRGSSQVVPVESTPEAPPSTAPRPVVTDRDTAPATTAAPPTTTTPTRTTAPPSTTLAPTTTVPRATVTTAPAPAPTSPPPKPKPGPPTTTITTPPSTATTAPA